MTELMSLDQIQWFHRVELEDGRFTPGITDIAQSESAYLFDKLDFQGKSVLDIGAWDGYFSFMAEKRGAKRVLSLDDPDFRWGGVHGYDFLHQHFCSQAEWRKGSIFDLPNERFDIVLCYGVLYHINDPLSAMINCFHAANQEVIFEGLIYDCSMPNLYLLAPKEVNDDPTNIYSMSTGFLEKVADVCGFELVETRYRRWSRIGLLRKLRRLKLGSDRATMRFKRIADLTPAYRASCFSVAPRALR